MAYAKEAVGERFDIERMRHASEQSWRGVEQMVAAFKPGIREAEAVELGRGILYDLGMERMWHPLHVRFGVNTTKTFKQKSDGDPLLGDNDIFFIDIGPVFDGHEGDVGASFVTGHDPLKASCAAAAKILFDDVRNVWKEKGLAGLALYDYAEQQAAAMGWRLNLDVKGHRVSDFPHALYKAGSLGAFARPPQPGVWILEIQIAHPDLPFGAFYEDLLI